MILWTFLCCSVSLTTFRMVMLTLICKFKTRCTITTVGLICISQWNEKTYNDCIRNFSCTSTNIDKAAIRQINKRNCLRRARIGHKEKHFTQWEMTHRSIMKRCQSMSLSTNQSMNSMISSWVISIVFKRTL